MAGQAQQTNITRQFAAILAVPTAIAGIYGMNFEHMPELKWTHGSYIMVGAIAAICVLLYAPLPALWLALGGWRADQVAI